MAVVLFSLNWKLSSAARVQVKWLSFKHSVIGAGAEVANEATVECGKTMETTNLTSGGRYWPFHNGTNLSRISLDSFSWNTKSQEQKRIPGASSNWYRVSLVATLSLIGEDVPYVQRHFYERPISHQKIPKQTDHGRKTCVINCINVLGALLRPNGIIIHWPLAPKPSPGFFHLYMSHVMICIGSKSRDTLSIALTNWNPDSSHSVIVMIFNKDQLLGFFASLSHEHLNEIEMNSHQEGTLTWRFPLETVYSSSWERAE